jgi:formate hydrogenlyase subunit 3/multisubunit Na+/H+ antiporter MnhD subunit
MDLFLAGLAALGVGGGAALLLASAGRERAALAVATASMLSGAALALIPALGVLGGGPALALDAPWGLPGARFALRLDRLSAFFVATIVGLSSVASVYGAGYLGHYRGRKALGPVLLFLNLLVVALCLVATARNAVLFLVAWELMTVFAFLLVCFEDERPEVRAAGFTYIVVSHIATILVVAFFLLLGRQAGSLDFDAIAAGPRAAPGEAHVLFALALLGFGTKAGAWPLHIWLPEAHPAAPTHVSAVMSGVIVKTAVYALVRGVTLLGPPPLAWGLALVAVGAISGLLGVLYALAQHDLKRLLAYHTIENIGIILIGIGTGFAGVACGRPEVAALGFAGGLLHVLNHGIFKSLLFFGAGAVLHATGARDIERLGGLARAMPWTAACFVVAAAAISGLPPLNGFVSEWLVYAGLLRGAADLPLGGRLAALLALAALAAIGGLAAACFAKAFGVVFLGAPRSDVTRGAHECGGAMRGAMLVLGLACVLIGAFPEAAARAVLPVAADLAGASGERAIALAARWLEPMRAIGRAALLALGAVAALALLRAALLARRPVAEGATWGCGYGAPSARMQYTASSFAESLLGLVRSILRPRVHDHAPEGCFPAAAERSTHTADLAEEGVYRPLARAIARALTSARRIQQGRLQLYLLYVLVTVVSLLLWQLAAGEGGS